MDGYTLLHSGRTLPDEIGPQVRNEGVGILLNRHATMAWKNAVETWEAVSSHVVTARLKVVGRGRRRPGGLRETSSTHKSVVSAYAPTAKAPLGVKAKFFDDLQDARTMCQLGTFWWCWGTSMRVWREERVIVMCGGRCERIMVWGVAMKLERGFLSFVQ